MARTDYEALERDYCIGKLSIRELAVRHGCAVSTVTLRAKKFGWTRDLSDAVRVATKAALIAESASRAEAIGKEIGTESAHRTDLAIRGAVSENLTVIGQHKTRTLRLSTSLNQIMQRLEEQLEDPLMLDALVLAVAANDPEAARELRKVTSVASHMDTLKKAAEINSRLQNDERISHNLNDIKPVDDERTRLLRKIVEEAEQSS